MNTESVTLILTFSTLAGEKKMSFKYADPSVITDTVKAAGAAIITNGSIFEYPPIELTKAILRTVTEGVFDLSDE